MRLRQTTVPRKPWSVPYFLRFPSKRSQERNAKPLLQLAYLKADGGLGEVEALRSSGKAAEAHHLDHCAELIQVQPAHLKEIFIDFIKTIEWTNCHSRRIVSHRHRGECGLLIGTNGQTSITTNGGHCEPQTGIASSRVGAPLEGRIRQRRADRRSGRGRPSHPTRRLPHPVPRARGLPGPVEGAMKGNAGCTPAPRLAGSPSETKSSR